ncbi:hypothetical protein JCM1840_006210 [Sporobolomyces johnsonii]
MSRYLPSSSWLVALACLLLQIATAAPASHASLDDATDALREMSLAISAGGEQSSSAVAIEIKGEGEELVFKLVVSLVLVLLGGLFSGLCIGLMGLDSTNLQVLLASGSPQDQRDARKVLGLLTHGRHAVLVCLQLSNVTVNETLPVFLDSVTGGGGVAAVLLSSFLILIVGEVVPQALCARRGLRIGAMFVSFVRVLMWLEAPVCYPTARLLDWLLGSHTPTNYRREELKTLIELHGSPCTHSTAGELQQPEVQIAGEGLTKAEVEIMGATLSLADRPVELCMRPINELLVVEEGTALADIDLKELLVRNQTFIPLRGRDTSIVVLVSNSTRLGFGAVGFITLDDIGRFVVNEDGAGDLVHSLDRGVAPVTPHSIARPCRSASSLGIDAFVRGVADRQIAFRAQSSSSSMRPPIPAFVAFDDQQYLLHPPRLLLKQAPDLSRALSFAGYQSLQDTVRPAAAVAMPSTSTFAPPPFSSAPFFFDRSLLDPSSSSLNPTAASASDGIVETYSGGSFARDGGAGSNWDASGWEMEGQAWRGGHSGGSASGVGIHSKPRVSYYFPRGVGEYHFGERHPMKPHRLTLTNHLVIGYGMHKKMDVFQPRAATKEELEMFHDEDYVDFLSRVTPDNVRHFTSVLNRFNIGDDCPIFSDMYSYCRQYAGASLMAARKLVHGSTDIAINWTGGLHHAKKSEASGFCYVNDIVLAILELLRVHARVLYIDIDIHHGDGVQEAFYNSNRVLTVSFHKYSPDFFPGTGHIDELGHALGKYFSLNVPLQDGIDNESYVALFKSIMEPTIHTFAPSAIVLQCGADSLGCDRLGAFNLSIAAHGECVRFIKSFEIPLLVVGGGGYTIKNVSRCWTYETAVLLGLEQQLPNSLPHTAYDDFFAPDWKLHPELAGGRNRVENMNERKQLERIRVAVLERLRYMHGAPSVMMSEVPPGLAQWVQEEEEEGDKEGDEDVRIEDPHRKEGEWFDGEKDGEKTGSAGSSRPTTAGGGGGASKGKSGRLSVSSGVAASSPSIAPGTGGKKRRKVGTMGPPAVASAGSKGQ